MYVCVCVCVCVCRVREGGCAYVCARVSCVLVWGCVGLCVYVLCVSCAACYGAREAWGGGEGGSIVRARPQRVAKCMCSIFPSMCMSFSPFLCLCAVHGFCTSLCVCVRM